MRQPWAWAIIHAGKDVENRTWRTGYRGPLLIHAAQAFDEEMHAAPLSTWRRYGIKSRPACLFERSAIVGVVDLVDIVQDSTSRWAIDGCYHWLLANPRPLEPVPAAGRLGLWKPQLKVAV